MNKEEFEKHRLYAKEKKPSMLRRRVGHDYEGRSIYLVTLTTEGRRPLLGTLEGRTDVEGNSPEAPHVALTELGEAVKREWLDVGNYHPEVSSIALQMMPDHLHGILFVKSRMPQHLGQVIKGFKASTNKHYRQLGYAATPSQQREQPSQQRKPGEKRDRSLDDREHGMLWSIGYNDHILGGKGELQRWIDYLADNPRRLMMKRQCPDLFRVRFGMTVAGRDYSALGNRFLLSRPVRLQVQCSRRLSDEDITERVEHFLAEARRGAVLVSPAISKGEKAVMRAAMNARMPLIFIEENGLTPYTKPGGEFFEACSQGKLLILAPWEHHNEKILITREKCLALNQMAKEICNQ